MRITMLKGKIHRARITHTEPDYEGSCAIDRLLLDAAGILPFEMVHVYDVTNGERFTTYAIEAPAGSGIVSMNGAAALRTEVGDCVILCAYAEMTPEEAQRWQPQLVYLDANNRIVRRARGTLQGPSIPQKAA